MGRAKVVVLALYVSLALLGRETEGQSRRSPTPLCASQFALVNHACSSLPYSSVPPPAPLGPPGPPSSPGLLSPEDPDYHHHHHQHHHRHHHHHHHHHHDPTPVEADCCRWLREVDNVCVCDLLVHLPAFLAKPAHEYTVVVADACNITYSCSGRVRP